MENDGYQKKLKIHKENEIKLKDPFKLLNPNQNIKGNIEFLNWKNLYIKKIGNNIKLFKCIKDNILFFTTNSDCKNYPFYQSKCPICNNFMCYFCSRYAKDSYGNGCCCLIRRVYCLFFQDGVRLINPVDDNNDYIPDIEDCFKKFIVPGFNLLYFI